MVSDWENNNCICKINAISGWAIETFYLVTQKKLGSSAVHLVGVDMIDIANSISIIETYFNMI